MTQTKVIVLGRLGTKWMSKMLAILRMMKVWKVLASLKVRLGSLHKEAS